MDQNQERRRGHFHRGRRGPDRRGTERRTPPPQERTAGRDQVDVEQIMREIRGRIAQRQGIDLSAQQIQDLAVGRLESILDPRAMKPSFLDALRRGAGAAPSRSPERTPNEPAYSFEDTTIYDSHRGLMRFVRRLLNPILKLFFNPNPLIRALHIQAKLNREAAAREAEREHRQAEWNALHYEILQRLVTEVSRAAMEVQATSLRVESLDAKVDFNERRVRAIEGSVQRARPHGRAAESQPAQSAAAGSTVNIEHPQNETVSSVAVSAAGVLAGPAPAAGPAALATPGSGAIDPSQPGDGTRRRRRRRRGRRSGGAPGEQGPDATQDARSATTDEDGGADSEAESDNEMETDAERESGPGPAAAARPLPPRPLPPPPPLAAAPAVTDAPEPGPAADVQAFEPPAQAWAPASAEPAGPGSPQHGEPPGQLPSAPAADPAPGPTPDLSSDPALDQGPAPAEPAPSDRPYRPEY